MWIKLSIRSALTKWKRTTSWLFIYTEKKRCFLHSFQIWFRYLKFDQPSRKNQSAFLRKKKSEGENLYMDFYRFMDNLMCQKRRSSSPPLVPRLRAITVWTLYVVFNSFISARLAQETPFKNFALSVLSGKNRVL